MSGRVQRRPTRPHDMTGMDDGRRKRFLPRRLDQIRLDLRLPDSVLAEGAPRLHFGSGNLDAGAVHPDRSRMQEMPHLTAQGLDQMSRARFGEADHVDDDIGPQIADFPAEGAGLLLGFAGEGHRADEFPSAMRLIRRALAAADGNHLESRGNQPRHEIGADMTASSDDYDARHRCSLRPPTLAATLAIGFSQSRNSAPRIRLNWI